MPADADNSSRSPDSHSSTPGEFLDIIPAVSSRREDLRLSDRTIRIWSLVLSSQFITHHIGRSSEGDWSLFVANESAGRALEQLVAYEQENADWDSTWVPPKTYTTARASFLFLATVAVVHVATTFGVGASRAVWLSFGSADAGLILSGQLWRTITALTLHADIFHVTSNVIIGGFFVSWLCRELGPGLGWFLVLVSGAVGNLMNALVQSPLHNSIGASTAVFGAIGLLSGLRANETTGASRNVFVPLVAGMILLAFLGSGGERTDVGAHLFGLISGVIIGVLVARRLRDTPIPNRRSQRMLAGLTALMPIVAWTIAFLELS